MLCPFSSFQFDEWGQLIFCHMQFECRIEHLVPDSLICFLCLTFMLHLAENKHNSALLEVVAATYLHPVSEILEGACNCACDVAMGREVEGCNPLPSRRGKGSIENKPGRWHETIKTTKSIQTISASQIF